MASVFLTGFPGFLGSELVARLLDRTALPIRCLVQDRYRDLAESRAAELADPDRVELHTGDITEDDLGLGNDYDDLRADAVEVYHLAAVYDLGVPRDVGMAVNVEGTRNVLDFADGIGDLRGFHYVSTCYVSGRHDGTFTHRDLDVGQSFNNHYEETKFLAEVEVQDRMDDGLPATIYRPAITVGDSKTGATQKYDGPYHVLGLLARQPRVAILPVFGDPGAYEVNVVPRNFVVDAIDHLSAREDACGEVYQLCDPNPPTVAEMVRAFGDALDKRVLAVPSSLGVSRFALESSPRLERALGVEPAALDYFVHPTSYTCENAARGLHGSEVRCPPFRSYVDELVEFYRSHPEISSDAMA
ncbi:SDR family oxidoreductase (plasmid) [Halorussus salilacus]|uniref:SDR family oxidoreductase n=1 Tax=Halorussus salilacus TaxID=2953750 RepID=UPI00209FC913|nr:SDR family oxidoreductase [Halorussus salilacus]USZ70149.1 SDR family oxidoreductase [Halorussus salilacus]